MLELVCDRLERRPIKQVERKDGVAERKDMVEGSRLLSSVYDADNVHFSLGRVVQGAEQEVAVFRRKMSWRAGCPDLEVESQAVPCIQSRKSRVRTDARNVRRVIEADDGATVEEASTSS